MNCKKCGTELLEGSVFCHMCGARQKPAQKEKSPRTGKVRGNGTGSVYKRGNSWQAEVCRCVEGIRLRYSKSGFARKKDALEYLPVLLAQLDMKNPENVSFLALWEKVQETARYQALSEEKKQAWGYAFKKCERLHACKCFRDIRFDQMQACVTGLTYYPARDVKILLNAMSTLAVKCEWADRNFAELIELPKQEAREKRVFTEEQIRALWEHRTETELGNAVLLMIYTGLRPIELRDMRVFNVRLNDREMFGGHKTELGKKSPIVIPEAIVPVLREMLSSAFGEYLVRQVCDNTFADLFTEALQAAGIDDKGLTPVCCRHTYITRLTRAGVAPAIIQKAARHTKYQTTLGYTHMDLSDVRDALNSCT